MIRPPMQTSPATEEHFDIARKNWRLVGIGDAKASAVLDGKSVHSLASKNAGATFPNVVIDLGKPEKPISFRYFFVVSSATRVGRW